MTRRRRRRPGMAAWDERRSFEEAFRVLRSNLNVALTDLEPRTVMITSANAGEGKTVTAASLAIACAQAGQRVVLVDVDLRHPNAHGMLGAHNEYGVSDVLLARRPLEEALQYVELAGPDGMKRPGLYFLGTGPQVANPSELLGSGRTGRLLEGLGRQADLVLLDTPPVLPVADTLTLGRMVGGALVVAGSRETNIGELQKAKDLLIRNQTRLVGVVLNKFRAKDAGYGGGYGYRYGYQYGYGTTETNGLAPEPSTNGKRPR